MNGILTKVVQKTVCVCGLESCSPRHWAPRVWLHEVSTMWQEATLVCIMTCLMLSHESVCMNTGEEVKGVVRVCQGHLPCGDNCLFDLGMHSVYMQTVG